MDKKALNIAGIILAIGLVVFGILAWWSGPTHTFDWIAILYYIWLVAVFWCAFGLGYWFWQQATASDWKSWFDELARKMLVDNPQLREFGNRLEDRPAAIACHTAEAGKRV